MQGARHAETNHDEQIMQQREKASNSISLDIMSMNMKHSLGFRYLCHLLKKKKQAQGSTFQDVMCNLCGRVLARQTGGIRVS